MLSASEEATGWLRSPAAALHVVSLRGCWLLLLLLPLLVAPQLLRVQQLAPLLRVVQLTVSCAAKLLLHLLGCCQGLFEADLDVLLALGCKGESLGLILLFAVLLNLVP
jgi:hypothetical protein